MMKCVFNRKDSEKFASICPVDSRGLATRVAAADSTYTAVHNSLRLAQAEYSL
jgi:hypothetical protein